jgi:multisubunit Na+/H+ antiporter MnhB subunit
MFRCLATYIILPVALPAFGGAWSNPVVGFSTFAGAIGFDVLAFRRVWITSHRLRRPMLLFYVGLIGALLSLLVLDLRRAIG